MYISHMRSEGNQLVEAVDELIKIAREAGVPAEIYHLKAAGQENWPKRRPRDRTGRSRPASDGVRITADMYLYTAGSTGSNGAMPPWVQEGGLRQVDRPHARSGDSQARRRGDAHADRRVGKPAAGRRLAGERAAGGLQEPVAQAPDRQDAGRGGRRAAARRPRKPPWTW